MRNTLKVFYFILGLVLVVLWQISLAPPLGLAFFHLSLLGGLIIGVKYESKFVVIWTILVGLIFDLLISQAIGPYLISYFLSLIVWPYLFGLLFESRSVGRLLVLSIGSVLIFELALLGMTYLFIALEINSIVPQMGMTYFATLCASVVAVSGLFLIFGREPKSSLRNQLKFN